ncbi:response regulator [bacterium]|jgi:two-component system, cell cycle sensor histidine kinase and response regulator CckA|nr:response regulator [bacterium]
MNLLVVEDNPGDLVLLREMLRVGERQNVLPSIEIKATARLQEALTHLKSSKPDLILLDLNLPDSNGMKTFKSLQEQSKEIPVIVLTGFTEHELGIEAIRSGAQDYLIKGQIEEGGLWRTVLYSLERDQLRRDLREQKQEVERQKGALQEHHDRIFAILSSNADGILIVDREEKIRYLNPAAEILLRKSREKVIGEKVWFPLITNTLTEAKIDAADSLEITLEVLVQELVWEQQPAYIASLRDITQRKILEERLRNTQKMQAIGRMAGGVAHEFNNLLAIIGGFNQLLSERGLDSNDASSWMGKIAKAVKRGATLTKYLLGFTRQGKYESRPLNLNDCVGTTLELIRHSFSAHTKIVKDLGPDLPDIVADRAQIENVIMNLLMNSEDAISDGGSIHIETKRVDLDSKEVEHHPWYFAPGSYCKFTVRDSGPGIESKVIDHIFEPFFTTKGPGRGTGLGLANVFGIVKNHDGHIVCKTNPNQGTSMEVYFPIPREVTPESLSAPSPLPLSCENAQVLVVDDEDDLLYVLESNLRDFGLEPISTNSGYDAIEIYRKHLGKIQAVFLDLKMPGIGGLEVFYKLREIHQDVRVILLTGYHKDRYVDRLLSEGAIGFLLKPFSKSEVRESLELLFQPEDSQEG